MGYKFWVDKSFLNATDVLPYFPFIHLKYNMVRIFDWHGEVKFSCKVLEIALKKDICIVQIPQAFGRNIGFCNMYVFVYKRPLPVITIMP